MPEPLKTLTSKAVVLSQSNIDTDQIIPGRFLSTTSREGLGAGPSMTGAMRRTARPSPRRS